MSTPRSRPAPPGSRRLTARLHGAFALLATIGLSLPCSAQDESLAPPAKDAAAVRAVGQLIVLNKSQATASFLAAISADGSAGPGSVLATVPVGDGPHEVAVSPDRALAVVTNYGGRQPGSSLTVLDIAEHRAIRTIELVAAPSAPAKEQPEPAAAAPRRYLRPHGIQFVDDHIVAVTCERRQRLLLVDIKAGTIQAALPTKAEASHMVTLSKDRSMAFVANIGSGSVSVLGLIAAEDRPAGFRTTIATGRGAEGIALHPKRNELWVTNRSADTVSVIDTETLKVVANLPCPGFPIRVAFTPDGQHALVSNARKGTVTVFDTTTREPAHQVAMDAEAIEDPGGRLFAGQFGKSPVPVGLLVEPSGRFAFVANTQADIITMIDLTKWRIHRRLQAGEEPDGMAYVPPAGDH